jgi:Ca2+-binding RTX toxin-like protein
VPASRLLRAAPVVLAASLLLAWASSALAAGERQRSGRDRATSTVRADTSPAVRSLLGRSTFSATSTVTALHHDGTLNLHLPPVEQNITMVGELEVNTPAEFRRDPTTGAPDPTEPNVVPGQIADVAVYKNFAYLNSWDEPSCRRGGTFIVDIANPAAPQQVGFLPALAGRYHGEGAHVISLDTRAGFRGDVLAVNNEPYTGLDPGTGDPCTDDIFGNGGFDLYDVTNPRDAKTLVQGAGDFETDGTEFETANSSHSIFIWQNDEARAFAVAVDNSEGTATDTDIFEITDPRNPRLIAEYDLDTDFGVDIVDEGGLGGAADVFLHDMVVKKMGDRYVMLADYWDAGYVMLDVTNPMEATYIGDSSFDEPDSLTGQEPQEGNGHQGEFSHDNRFILAADEDFSPFRPLIAITTGPNAGEFDAAPIGGAASPAFLPDERLNGPTVYGGYGCDASDPIPPNPGLMLDPGEEAIVVLQRGPSGDPDNPEEACFPGEKAENGINAGYDAVLLTNHHPGEAGGVFCGSGDFPPAPPIVAVCTSHEGLHTIFGEPNNTDVPYPPGHGPPLGDLGEDIEATATFDGWGYARLISTSDGDGDGKLDEIDAHALEESLNPNFSVGFGDLSIHEFATDPTEYVAYSAYYAGGMRVFTFGDGGLTEQGKWIDDEGSNFWGVEQFTLGNQRYFAGSDRDFGLQIFKYTGPGAAQRPTCINSTTMVPYRTTTAVGLPCSDANGNQLTISNTSNPTQGSLGAVDQSAKSVSYRHTGNALGTDQFMFKANDGTMDSDTMTAQIAIVPGDGGRCSNPFVGTAAARESITGSPFGDVIRGGRGADFIEGQGGDDCLHGQGGRDQLDGDTGNDVLRGGGAKDRLFGGSGRDSMVGGSGNDHIRGSSGNDTAQGGVGVDIVDGGSNADRLRGGRGNDRLRGGPGRDRVFGQGGRDRLEAGDGRRNLLSGGNGGDRVLAVNGRRDTVRCGGGRDRVQADRRDNVRGDCEVVRRARPRD